MKLLTVLGLSLALMASCTATGDEKDVVAQHVLSQHGFVKGSGVVKEIKHGVKKHRVFIVEYKVLKTMVFKNGAMIGVFDQKETMDIIEGKQGKKI